MQILVNTDSNIEATEAMVDEVEDAVDKALTRFKPRLTRVEVHFKDGSAGRSTPDDITCTLEARPAGGNPLVVTDNASTVTESLTGSLHKLGSMLDSTFGKLDNHKGGPSMGDELPG